MDAHTTRRLAWGGIGIALAVALALPSAQSRTTAKPDAAPGVAQVPRSDAADLDAVARIKEEGLQRSQVMDTLWYLTDVHGPRLTNSPGMRAAATWAAGRLREWGVANVREEPFRFGRGWSNEKLTANVLVPRPFPLVAAPRAWTPGTNSAVTADVVVTAIRADADFAAWTGKLAGKVVLNQPVAQLQLLTTPLARRFTDQELTDLQTQPVNPGRGRGARAGGAGNNAAAFTQRLNEFFAKEGVVATLEPGSGRNDRGTILVHNAPASYYGEKPPALTPQLIVASEQYNRILRLVDGKVPVQVELNVQNRFTDTLDSLNVVAELPGTDKAAEIVMLGAHFDSWHSATGATDNAAGSAAMMEAMRILKATGLRLRRTVRLALWTGEEQGLLGSRAYVKQRFGDRDTMVLTQEHARLSGYFNMDNGGGAIRGVYLQGNEAVRPVFAAWLEPFRSLGMTTLSIRNTGSTDHVAFDEVGLPGFQFIQDPLEYGSDSHHSNNDAYDRIPADDMMKNAVIIASFVYHAANRDEPLPRKPLPRPRKPAPAPASTQ
jgi:carboxypeptidase Q